MLLRRSRCIVDDPEVVFREAEHLEDLTSQVGPTSVVADEGVGDVGDDAAAIVHQENSTDELLPVQVEPPDHLDRGNLGLDEGEQRLQVLLGEIRVGVDDDRGIVDTPDVLLVQVAGRVDQLELGVCRGTRGAHEELLPVEPHLTRARKYKLS